MNDVTNYYDDMDLKYPEIAICIEDIDRINPGKKKFIIPVLTPNMSTSEEEEETIYQDNSSLINRDTKPEVDDLDVTNYLTISIPKELCAFVGGCFQILQSYSWPNVDTQGTSSILNVKNANESISGSKQYGSGGVVEGGSINVYGGITGVTTFSNGIPTGYVNLMPVDRYIKKNSKWIVAFIGGDVTDPKIIARYPEDDEE